MYIILPLLIIWVGGIAINYIIFKSRRLYCFVFEHKDWKLWNKICKHLKEAKLIKCSVDNNGAVIYFQFELVIDFIDYDVMCWCADNTVSIHHNNECILSSFDKYNSNKAAKIIRQYLL